MRTAQLLKRNLSHYWRTNLAVVLGVATAVAVLSGALLVGDSVRASLSELALQRLGQTDRVITSIGFFRDQLANDLQGDSQFAVAGFAETCPLIALEGTVTHERSKRVASRIKVYGVDERFWKFHRLPGKQPPRNREVFLSEGLARELSANTGDALVLRVEKPSAIPVESLHSRKEDLGSTLRLTLRETLSPGDVGEFSLQPQQGDVRALFVPLSTLQKAIDQPGRANLILISEASRDAAAPAAVPAKNDALMRILKARTSLDDFGIKLRIVGQPASQANISLEQESKVISGPLSEVANKAANALSLHPMPVLSYLANSITAGERSIPYSLVTGLDESGLGLLAPGETRKPDDIILNEWAARELGARPGDPVSLDYYVWREAGLLETKTARFRLAAVVPITGLAADRDLVPEYPGITGSKHLADWDPPFPVDLKRIRKQDEGYWDQYRTTPKAFIPLATAQQLWQTRFGKLTSIRLVAAGDSSPEATLDSFQRRLKTALDPAAMGFALLPVRSQALEASRGATDFGEYFLYFSFFLVISALMLSALFFKLGIEQRLREIGLLQAVGFPAAKIRKLFLAEGLLLAIIGSLIGLAGAVGYGQFVIVGLRTWWVDAVGTTMLRLHVSPLSLGLGAAGGIIAALLCIVWTLRGLGKESTRTLLAGIRGNAGQTIEGGNETRGMRRRLSQLLHFNFSSQRIGTLLVILALVLLIAATFQRVNQVAGFFGGGTLVLAAALCYQSAWLRRPSAKPIAGTGWWSVTRLGFRNATSRPGRSVLCIALIASAAFIIVAVDSFRHRGGPQPTDRRSGNGGFPLLAESLLPIVHNPNTSEGREALNLNENDEKSPLSGLNFATFRVRPGDDASCLNLYQPRNPKIIAPTDDFVRSNRFAFQNSLATTDEEKNNPWLLLNREFSDGAVPVIADANSLTYVLHRKLGDDLVLDTGNGPIRLRLVGSLADSLFQSELVMGEANFVRLFPDQQGYRFFLIDTPALEQSNAIATRLEDRLSDFGFDVQATSERLAGFHRVENTYLSTFQMLGGLGLVLGTLGMAAVLLRNVLERRRELALLRVVGYNSSHFALMVIAENALLLCCGLITGAVCALLAIAPVFFTRHAQLPSVALGLLLLGVLISGLTASVVATWAVLRSPLLPALRAE
ncbi:MAG TPA: FtsX-like permease family protein [Pyrinomonadaceae bacterium]|nr:FtsX-like permease family protein [Pyrinomonadaceae bacterium]